MKVEIKYFEKDNQMIYVSKLNVFEDSGFYIEYENLVNLFIDFEIELVDDRVYSITFKDEGLTYILRVNEMYEKVYFKNMLKILGKKVKKYNEIKEEKSIIIEGEKND
jgi:hypothetical protein